MPFYARSRSAWIAIAVTISALALPAYSQQADTSSATQTTASKAENKQGEKLEEVVVTGTNIRTDVSERAAIPLTVISADDIALQGPQSLVQTLRENPAFSGGTSNGGSGGYFAGAVTTLNLYGIGDAYTLVLVNGRRFNAVTPTNIANIPASAISNIEILKDGGSSIYGSDAVAGVVNIILNKSYQGMEVSASYGDRIFGADFGAHAKDLTTGIKFGLSSDRARFVGNMEFRKRGETKMTDTELGRDSNFDQRVIYTSPANIILPSGEDVILNYHVFKPGSYSLNPADYIPYDLGDYNKTIAQVQRATLTDRQPQTDVSGYGHAEYDLTDKASLFAEVYYSQFHAHEQDKDYGVDFYGDPHLDFGPVPATNPWNPFGVALRDVYYALPELGGVDFHSSINTTRVVGGVKGEVGPFAYEVGITNFRNDETDQSGNYYSDSAIFAAINRTGPDALNPFCYGCNTPAQLAGIDISNELETISQQSIIDAKLSGPVLKRDNYDVAFAAGAETRKEKWDFEVDPLTATGDNYYNQQTPDSQQRRSSAVFGELAFHLGEGANIPAVHKLTVNVSARHEWIESVGGTTNPHVAVSWQPLSPAFMLRASYGTSFRAPPINLLRSTQTTVNDYLTYPQFGNLALPTDVVEGGNPNLRPETARTFNAGFIIAPSQLYGSSLSVDRIQIRQSNVVLIPDPQAIVDGTFPGTVDYSGARPLINATARNVGGRKVEGFDFSLNLRYPTERIGTFGFRYNGVVLTQFEVDNGQGFVSQLGQFSNYLFNVGSPGALGSLPRVRWNGGPTWTSPSGDITAQITANYVSHYHDGFGTNRWVGEFITYDFNLNADLSRFVPGLSGSLGILNILSTPPPLVEGYGTTFVYYDPGLSNSLGRLGFVGLKYHF